MDNRYNSELTLLEQEILSFLFANPDIVFNINSLARRLEKSQPGISKAVHNLEKHNYILISKDKESGRWSIGLNRDNQKVIFLKRVENLKEIYSSGVVEFLFGNFPGATIIVFGSYSRGEDTTNSDIDIAIIGCKEKNISLIKYDKILEKEIVVNFYDSLIKLDKNMKNNLMNGIVLSGSVEL